MCSFAHQFCVWIYVSDFFRVPKRLVLFESAHQKKENNMLQLALLFLVIALIAGALGLFNAAVVSSQIAWTLFVVFLILFVVSLVLGRRAGPPV
jgi:uncharacterized membrane protein YtjA (UPF0391 family)